MRVLILFAYTALSACGAGPILTEAVDPSVTAETYVGLHERQDRAILRELTGVDPVRTEWCAAFVNAILEKDDIPGSESVSDVPLMARSFLFWGEAVDPADIQRGDVVIFPRGRAGWQGHVGFYIGTTEIDGKEQWMILGGNQDNTVSYSFYNPTRALGVRRYKEDTNVSERKLRTNRTKFKASKSAN